MAAQNHAATAKNIILENRFMVLSTADIDGVPWGATVYYAFNKGLDFYFLSAVDSRHSMNLASNPRVSFVIFDSGQPMGRAESIQAEGNVSIVSLPEDLEAVIRLYSMRQFPKSALDPLRRYPPYEFGPTGKLRFYRIRIENMYVSGTANIRTEVDQKQVSILIRTHMALNK